GPAYLDRVLRVDRPLRADSDAPPLDQSVDGRGEFTAQPADGLRLVGADCPELSVALPDGWPGPWGVVHLNRSLGGAIPEARGLAWHDDLGGMGAGPAVRQRDGQLGAVRA